MAENRSNDLFSFEPGDVSITVMYDGEICTGMVSSHAMALGSPVWEKFLFPPWSEWKETKDLEGQEQDVQTSPVQQLNFVEDDGEALLILLRITHLQFKEIPTALTCDLLLDLAILVDQYDCISIIRPWLATWLANEEAESKAPGHEFWLFIAWAFGRNEIFKGLALKMVKEIMVGGGGVTFTSSGQRMPQPMPDGIIENIFVVRQATIDKLLDIPYAHVDRYENSDDAICRQGGNYKACDALVYGSLIRGLQIAGLWPRKKPEEIHVSIDQLTSRLNSLEIFALPVLYSGYPSCSHGSCNVPNFRQQVQTALSGIPFPVLDSHYRHMEAQKALRPIEVASTESAKLFCFRHGNAQIQVTHCGELVVGKVSSHCMALASKSGRTPSLILERNIKRKARGHKVKRGIALSLDGENETHKNQHVERQGPTGENDKQETSSWPAKEADFRDYDSEALLILLRIAHLQYNDVPTTLAYKTLLDVAILCNRYSYAGLVEPWLSQWLSDEKESWKEAGHENWLFIAWVFGRDQVFYDLAARMVQEATTNDDNKCLISSGAEVSGPMPPQTLERIQGIREELIKDLLEVPYNRLHQYESTTASICCRPGNKESCDAAIYGSIARGLQKAGLWPRKRAGDIHISAKELATRVTNIRIYPLNINYDNHYICGLLDFGEQVTNILSAVPSSVLDLITHRHIELQKQSAT